MSQLSRDAPAPSTGGNGAWIPSARSVGQSAFAHVRATLRLARDGVGVCTVYHGRHDGRVLFAVEPRAVLATPGLPERIRAAGERSVVEQAYAEALPPEAIARPKSGMRVPVRYWFGGELRRYARHVLGDRAIRAAGIFDPARVRQLLDCDTNEGPGRCGIRLWMLPTFEIWHRIVIEREPV